MANRTYPQNEVYAEGFDRIFGKRDVLNEPIEENEEEDITLIKMGDSVIAYPKNPDGVLPVDD